MATPKIIADFETQLSTALAVGGTSFTLRSATDDDGVSLPAGLYYFTVDNGSNQKEYLAGTLSGTSVTSVLSVSRQGAETSGAARAHRVGASVIMTDFATYKKYMDEIALVSAPDGSTSAKGVFEAPTLAEVRARTATGGTGAKLAVTPDVLDDLPTQDEKAGLAGYPSAPTATNLLLTRAKSVTAGATINGATLPVPVYQNKTDNEFYACDGNDTAAMKFLGFAISNGTDGASMLVQFNGIVSGFTGLDEGEKYYLSDTVGTISNTIGTYEVLVGVAISTTELLIQKGTRRAGGTTSSGTATGSTAIVCGFRPSVVRLTALSANSAGTNVGLMSAVWVNGSISAVRVSTDDGGSETLGTGTGLVEPADSGSQMAYSITSVTDTGFTISWTETGTVDISQPILWEAEGEL